MNRIYSPDASPKLGHSVISANCDSRSKNNCLDKRKPEVEREKATGVDHLVVIAAPEAAGKSTLMRKIDQLTELKTHLTVESFEKWQRVTLGLIRRSQLANLNRLVLFECNTLSAYCRQINYEHDTPMTQLLQQARAISIVTLWTPPDRLRRQRIERDLRRIRKSLSVYGYRRAMRFGIFCLLDKSLNSPLLAPLKKIISHHQVLQRVLTFFCGRYFTFYLLPTEILRCYHDWLRFCDSLEAKTIHHYIAELDGGLRLYSRHEWRNLVSSSRVSLL